MRTVKKFLVKPNRICPICGVSFYAEPNRITKSMDGIVYCSNQCSHKTGDRPEETHEDTSMQILGLLPGLV